MAKEEPTDDHPDERPVRPISWSEIDNLIQQNISFSHVLDYSDPDVLDSLREAVDDDGKHTIMRSLSIDSTEYDFLAELFRTQLYPYLISQIGNPKRHTPTTCMRHLEKFILSFMSQKFRVQHAPNRGSLVSDGLRKIITALFEFVKKAKERERKKRRIDLTKSEDEDDDGMGHGTAGPSVGKKKRRLGRPSFQTGASSYAGHPAGIYGDQNMPSDIYGGKNTMSGSFGGQKMPTGGYGGQNMMSSGYGGQNMMPAGYGGQNMMPAGYGGYDMMSGGYGGQGVMSGGYGGHNMMPGGYGGHNMMQQPYHHMLFPQGNQPGPGYGLYFHDSEVLFRTRSQEDDQIIDIHRLPIRDLFPPSLPLHARQLPNLTHRYAADVVLAVMQSRQPELVETNSVDIFTLDLFESMMRQSRYLSHEDHLAKSHVGRDRFHKLINTGVILGAHPIVIYLEPCETQSVISPTSQTPGSGASSMQLGHSRQFGRLRGRRGRYDPENHDAYKEGYETPSGAERRRHMPTFDEDEKDDEDEGDDEVDDEDDEAYVAAASAMFENPSGESTANRPSLPLRLSQPPHNPRTPRDSSPAPVDSIRDGERDDDEESDTARIVDDMINMSDEEDSSEDEFSMRIVNMATDDPNRLTQDASKAEHEALLMLQKEVNTDRAEHLSTTDCRDALDFFGITVQDVMEETFTLKVFHRHAYNANNKKVKLVLTGIQIIGAYWDLKTAHKEGFMLIADEPGKGKTCQMYIFIGTHNQIALMWRDVQKNPTLHSFGKGPCKRKEKMTLYSPKLCVCHPDAPDFVKEFAPENYGITIAAVTNVQNWIMDFEKFFNQDAQHGNGISSEGWVPKLVAVYNQIESDVHRKEYGYTSAKGKKIIDQIKREREVTHPGNAQLSKYIVITTQGGIDGVLKKTLFGKDFNWETRKKYRALHIKNIIIDEGHKIRSVDQNRISTLAAMVDVSPCKMAFASLSGTPHESGPHDLMGLFFVAHRVWRNRIRLHKLKLRNGEPPDMTHPDEKFFYDKKKWFPGSCADPLPKKAVERAKVREEQFAQVRRLAKNYESADWFIALSADMKNLIDLCLKFNHQRLDAAQKAFDGHIKARKRLQAVAEGEGIKLSDDITDIDPEWPDNVKSMFRDSKKQQETYHRAMAQWGDDLTPLMRRRTHKTSLFQMPVSHVPPLRRIYANVEYKSDRSRAIVSELNKLASEAVETACRLKSQAENDPNNKGPSWLKDLLRKWKYIRQCLVSPALHHLVQKKFKTTDFDRTSKLDADTWKKDIKAFNDPAERASTYLWQNRGELLEDRFAYVGDAIETYSADHAEGRGSFGATTPFSCAPKYVVTSFSPLTAFACANALAGKFENTEIVVWYNGEQTTVQQDRMRNIFEEKQTRDAHGNIKATKRQKKYHVDRIDIIVSTLDTIGIGHTLLKAKVIFVLEPQDNTASLVQLEHRASREGQLDECHIHILGNDTQTWVEKIIGVKGTAREALQTHIYEKAVRKNGPEVIDLEDEEPEDEDAGEDEGGDEDMEAGEDEV